MNKIKNLLNSIHPFISEDVLICISKNDLFLIEYEIKKIDSTANVIHFNNEENKNEPKKLSITFNGITIHFFDKDFILDKIID